MVSIHAPARGATYLDRLPIHHHGVSIHAPRGVRQSALGAYEKVYQFQFTHPRGVRPGRNPAAIKVIMFQFTHPRGVRQKMRREADEAMTFQFTHPRGVRLGIVPSALAEGDVSIHAPARGATYPCTTEEWNKLFQFTHPRGVRLRHQSRWSHRCRVSIHAPARGATNQRLRQRTLPKRFNSRTREGCDEEKPEPPEEEKEFQFTHPRGVRRE